FHARSIEQRVLEHLRLRERRAASAFDRRQVTEMAIAGAVFGDEALETVAPVVIHSTIVTGAGEEAMRVERQRRAHSLGAGAGDGVGWTSPRYRQGRIVLLHCRS